ncbi:photosystem reaction center subunit H [Serinicoccus sp. CNJ-927]|uniref:DUF2382 domain-containing protein n=1 Tax=Serinicoccus sp. CNJ-927 TaxID=1904970 RepID=UPI00095B9DC7|nr:PRC and DUF2382 domain-containing protein [Serinicoccus sp. CNJ-927]OLT40138.1 photosystem reaction center subunit H [Serinicoccus sp. CNJ-927]
MWNEEQIQSLHNDGVVVDQDGEKVGKVGQVYLEDSTGEPAWVTVKTGLFGTSESFVPLQGATVQDQEVRVPYTKDQVKDAPRVEEDGHISVEEERELFRYYGGRDGQKNANNGAPATRDQEDTRTGTTSRTDTATGMTDRTDTAAGADDTGRGTYDTDSDASMVRSEEQLNVGTEKVTTGKARLRKYVVTEHVTKTVPVQREEVRIEREPLDQQDRDRLSGADLVEDEQEVTLTEDQVVVDKETVPVEEVRLDTDTVTEEQQVSDEVRKEQIDTDLPDQHRNH